MHRRLRIAIFAVVGAVAVMAGLRDCFLNISREMMPAAATLVALGDVRPAFTTLSRSTSYPSSQVSLANAKLARQMLVQEPLSPPAMRILSDFAAQHGHDASARNLLSLAEAMSRRDGGTQILLMVDAARRNDATAALHHLDLAATTVPSAATLTYPMLDAIIANGAVEHPMVELMKRNRPWMNGFLAFAAQSTPHPTIYAKLLIDSGLVNRARVEFDVVPLVLERLSVVGDFQYLVRLARAIPGSPSDIAREAAIDSAGRDPRFGPLAWQFPQLDEAGAQIAKAGATYVISGYTRIELEQVVARKLLVLPAGSYTIAARAIDPVQGNSQGSATFAVTCLGAPAPLGESPNMLSVRAMSLRFSVPTNCHMQRLELKLGGIRGGEELSVAIGSVALARASAER